MKEDNTCYIERSKVREILITSNANNETTRELLADVDALTIFVASDFAAPRCEVQRDDLRQAINDASEAARRIVYFPFRSDDAYAIRDIAKQADRAITRARAILAAMPTASREPASAAQAAQVPAAWLVKWAMKNSGPQASAYLKEDDARRAAKNVEAYSHATGVEVLPVYTAQPLSAPLPHKLPFHDETMDRLDSLTIRASSVPSADREGK